MLKQNFSIIRRIKSFLHILSVSARKKKANIKTEKLTMITRNTIYYMCELHCSIAAEDATYLQKSAKQSHLSRESNTARELYLLSDGSLFCLNLASNSETLIDDSHGEKN